MLSGMVASNTTSKGLTAIDKKVNISGMHTPNTITEVRYGERRISDEEYDILRKQTPTSDIRKKIQEQFPIGSDDPAIPGKKIESTVQADHIVSMDKIARMENFDKLSFADQVDVLNYEENFTGLSKPANASKGAKSYAEWEVYKKENIPISKEYRDRMSIKEANLEIKLQTMIDDLASK